MVQYFGEQGQYRHECDFFLAYIYREMQELLRLSTVFVATPKD